MTKLKSKKMTKSTFAIIIMAIAMVAMLAFGGTYAYFTAQGPTATADDITTATVAVSSTTEVQFEKTNVVSGESIISTENWSGLTLTNESTVATYVFVVVSATFAKSSAYTGNVTPTSVTDTPDAEGEYKLDIVMNAAEGWLELEDEEGNLLAYYKEVADKTTKASIAVLDNIKFYGHSESGVANGGSLMGGTITATLNIRAIQTIAEADGSKMDAQDAYDILFPAAQG